MNTKLVLLIVSLPPNPSSLRVRVWRRLRAIGAVALKRTVYLLPDSPDHYEHFQWLAQEIQRAGGEATLLRVDRIASAWLIKRFIDPDATFVFADPREFPTEAIQFDTPGAELSHVGDDCTFETLIKRAGLRDRRLTRLAEIVHEADLRDGKFPRDEARGIDLVIRGLLAAHSDDHEVLTHGLALFEGLYEIGRAHV